MINSDADVMEQGESGVNKWATLWEQVNSVWPMPIRDSTISSLRERHRLGVQGTDASNNWNIHCMWKRW